MVSEIPSNWNTLQFSFILPVSSVVTSQWLKAHLLADRSVRANSQNPARLHVGLRLLRAVEVPSLSGRRGRRQLALASPSCSSICCSSVTTRKRNLFITCLLFSNIYIFYCSIGGVGRELLKSQWIIWPIIVKIKRWYQFWSMAAMVVV